MGETKYSYSTVAVFGLLEREGRYLLTKRKNTGYMPGMYSLPAGKVEPGESLTGAAIREIKEEAGVDVPVRALKLVHTAQHVPDSYIYAFFSVANWEGEPYNAEPDKSDDVSWHDKENLPVNIVPLIRSVLGTQNRSTLVYLTQDVSTLPNVS